jgi:LEA14-like dessication related protein
MGVFAINPHRRNPTMRRFAAYLAISFAVFAVAGCAAGLYPHFETPKVTVNSVRALRSKSISPRFEIGLHITNPNRYALKLDGIAYRLRLEGYDVLTGVANNLPKIDGYGEKDISLIATISLMDSMRFLAELMDTQPDSIAYDLSVKLDIGGFRPPIHVTDKGSINLTDQPQRSR